MLLQEVWRSRHSHSCWDLLIGSFQLCMSLQLSFSTPSGRGQGVVCTTCYPARLAMWSQHCVRAAVFGNCLFVCLLFIIIIRKEGVLCARQQVPEALFAVKVLHCAPLLYIKELTLVVGRKRYVGRRGEMIFAVIVSQVCSINHRRLL